MKAILLSTDSHSDARQCSHAYFWYFCVIGVRAYILFVVLLLHLTLVCVSLYILTLHVFLLVMATKWSPAVISDHWLNFSFNTGHLGCFQSFPVRNIFTKNIVHRLFSHRLMHLLEWLSLPKPWKWYQLIILRVLRSGCHLILRLMLIHWLADR